MKTWKTSDAMIPLNFARFNFADEEADVLELELAGSQGAAGAAERSTLR